MNPLPNWISDNTKAGLYQKTWVRVDPHNDDWLTNNFRFREFAQNGPSFIAADVVSIAQYLRDFYGRPITVTSAYRDHVPSGPGVVGAVVRSPHMLGVALDLDGGSFDLAGAVMQDFFSNEDFRGELFRLGLRGIGFYSGFLHVDTYPYPPRSRTLPNGEAWGLWSYRPEKLEVSSWADFDVNNPLSFIALGVVVLGAISLQ